MQRDFEPDTPVNVELVSWSSKRVDQLASRLGKHSNPILWYPLPDRADDDADPEYPQTYGELMNKEVCTTSTAH